MEGASFARRIVAADVPDRGRMYYLIDGKFDFITDTKAFLDRKAAKFSFYLHL